MKYTELQFCDIFVMDRIWSFAWRKNTDWERLWRDFWGEYLDL